MPGTRDRVDPAEILSFRITDAAVVAFGDFVVVASATGLALRLTDVAGRIIVGRVIDFDPPDVASDGSITGDTASDFPPEAVVATVAHVLERITVVGASTIADVSADVFMTAERTFTLTPTASIPSIGSIVRFHSATEFDVLVRPVWELMQG